MTGESILVHVEEAAPGPRTIADGFSARRYARGTDRRSELLSNHLVRIATEHPEVNLHLPSFDPVYDQRADVDVVRKSMVRARSSQLGELGRRAVYRTIERSVPSVHRDLAVTAQSLVPGEETTMNNGTRLIVVDFDPDPETELNLEGRNIGSALARLSGETLEGLRWLNYPPNLQLAYVPKGVPEDTYEELRGVIETLLPFRLMLSPVRLEPRLEPYPAPA